MNYTKRAEHIIEQCKKLYPIKGLIISPDLDRLAERFADFGMTLHSWPSGATCGDWVVPQSWRALHGRLEDTQGRTLASTDQSFLFVAAHSEPVDDWFTRRELHVQTRSDQPQAFVLETRCAYDAQYKTWAITLPHALYSSLSDTAKYRVVIETETKPGRMYVGESCIHGDSASMICLNSHTDELCNDGFSSAFAVLDIMAQLRPSKYTYQALLGPELFGPIFYAQAFPWRLGLTRAMLNLETLGAGTYWACKESLGRNSLLDRALMLALQDLKVPHQRLDFFSGYGNDERVYGWPTLGIPGTSLQRYPFAQYHTSLDTPGVLSANYLAEALEIVERCLNVLESDYVPSWTSPIMPWLTKHGLYKPGLDRLLFRVDGKRAISDLALLTGKPFSEVYASLAPLRAAGLLTSGRP